MSVISKAIADMLRRIQNWLLAEARPDSVMAQGMRLNIFQKGILSLIFVVSLGVIVLAAGQIFSSWLFVNYIKNSSIALLCAYGIASTVIVVSICAAIFKFALRINLAWPVTFSKVIEFSHALRNLKIFELDEQIRFVAKQEIDVFVSDVEIPEIYKDNIRAKRYGNFSDKEKIKNLIGGHRLCFNIVEYERIVQQYKQRCSIEESAILMEKEQEVNALKMTVSSISADKTKLESELALVRDENATLKKQKQMQPAQEETRVERLRVERLLWVVYIPVMERLMREAPKGKQYTTLEIEAAFVEEWEHRVDLQEQMLKLTKSAEAKPSTAFMGAVKAEFKDAGLLHPGGRPGKNH